MSMELRPEKTNLVKSFFTKVTFSELVSQIDVILS